jgi:hypothetical protein
MMHSLTLTTAATTCRFWYENGDDVNPGGAFTLAQLQEIRKTSLARTICDNLDDIDVLQPFAFLMVNELANRRTACRGNGIPRMNIDLWKESRSAAAPLLYSGEIFAKWMIKTKKQNEREKQATHYPQ